MTVTYTDDGSITRIFHLCPGPNFVCLSCGESLFDIRDAYGHEFTSSKEFFEEVFRNKDDKIYYIYCSDIIKLLTEPITIVRI